MQKMFAPTPTELKYFTKIVLKIRFLKCLFNSKFLSNFINGEKEGREAKKNREEDKKKQDEEK